MITNDYDNYQTRVQFGHGTVAVGTNYIELTFQNIRPPQEVGTDLVDIVDEIEFYGPIYSTQLKWEDIKSLREYLNIIEKDEGGCFSFHGFVFDFEVYDPRSLTAIRNQLKNIEYQYLRSIAC